MPARTSSHHHERNVLIIPSCSQLFVNEYARQSNGNSKSFDGAFSTCSTADSSSISFGCDTLDDSFAQSSYIDEGQVSYHSFSFNDDTVTATSGATTDDLVQSRRLRFLVDDRNNIIEEVFEFITNEDSIEDIYTTMDEEKQNRREFRRTARHLRRSHIEMIQLLEKCYETGYIENSSFFNDWAGSELRGFEGIFSEQSCEQISSYVSLVVTYQVALQSLIDNETDRKNLDEILRSRIVNESKKSREFAYRMANADEMEVRVLK